jgi:S-adenosylmethionine:tRNA ribosyltransferase-isomerase
MIDFDLPKELVAQEPVHPRDSARLLVYNRKTKKITDTVFSSIDKYLHPETTIVVNNSKVERCRWLFDDAKTEIFVLEKLDTHTVRALVRPGKKFKLNQICSITDWLDVETTAIDDDGIRTLKLNITHDDERLRTIEHIPFPPYIKQNDSLADEYQTVYAKPPGSKAAPTAGLHFTNALLQKLRNKHTVTEVTLHVGLGTFASLTDENFQSGTLHKESYSLSPTALESINNAKHVTAIGTTTTRTLESWKKSNNSGGTTDIFIQPGFKFKAVDSIVTNFHLPRTSLLLMIEAFIGSESEMKRIYEDAIVKKYRFYSFGDAMLIL